MSIDKKNYVNMLDGFGGMVLDLQQRIKERRKNYSKAKYNLL